MKLDVDEEDILNAPVASGGGMFFCPDPKCGLPHLLLVDDFNEPMAHFIISPEFFEEIRAAMEKANARKN